MRRSTDVCGTMLAVEQYITLRETSVIAGYRSKSTLISAAALGRLETARQGVQLFTTRAWLDAYLERVRQGNYGRGIPRLDDDEERGHAE